MRIKDMITQDESNWHFNKLSPLLLFKTYRDNKWEFEFIGLRSQRLLWGFLIKRIVLIFSVSSVKLLFKEESGVDQNDIYYKLTSWSQIRDLKFTQYNAI